MPPSPKGLQREWLPWSTEYLNVILEEEQLAKGGICEECSQAEGCIRCMSCTGVHAWCGPCAVKAHKNLPFHKVQRWNGTHYEATSLMELGFLWHIGHGGLPCPRGPENPNLEVSGYESGEGPPHYSISKPKTAFTFDVLNYFLVDALECKTSAMSFYTQHMKMNKPELDVALSGGKGYMVSEGPYQSHLQQSLDSKEIFKKGKGCQWSVNFHQWVKSSPSLLLPPVLEIIPAVGKFHLAAHKLSCFPRYSLNFIKGAGHLDGEILETLWAPFNKISPTARSMSQAHRQEVYDDHTRDSNWKKLVGIVPSLLKKHKMANKCLEEMNQAYAQLTAVLDPDKVAQWELDALRAEADRGEALDIYLLKGDKAPTFHEVQLKLTKHPKAPSGNLGSVAWLAEGISIEDSQPMSTRQEVKVSQKRQRLSTRIEKFHTNGQAFFKTLEVDGAFIPQDDPAFCGKEEEDEEDWEFWHDDEGDWEAPEEDSEELASKLMSIWMPSSIGAAKLMELGLHDLLKEERELRIGQANDWRIPDPRRKSKKWWPGSTSMSEVINGPGRPFSSWTLMLTLKKGIKKSNQRTLQFGQGTSKLAWFWMMDGDERQLNVEAGGLMAEWQEETDDKKKYCCLWFKHHKNIWEKRALQSTKPGKAAYANKQIGLWSDFDKKARLMFQGQYKEARGNSELQNEILAEVKSEILQQAAPGSVTLPNNLRVAIRRVFLLELDPEDQDDEENIIQHILSVSEKRKEDAGEGEHVREERERPTKAGDYRKPFTAFTCGQRLFKDDLNLYDGERRDTKDPKTIGQRTKTVQKWWESLSDDRKAEAMRMEILKCHLGLGRS
ncbi:hypothetical protein EDC04DRAFT_2612855 [Pisolithus marmoratus]|nr:hypothetical protein EDC04DRAFT_2612855 [Pisolithus marmoratus]